MSAIKYLYYSSSPRCKINIITFYIIIVFNIQWNIECNLIKTFFGIVYIKLTIPVNLNTCMRISTTQ